MPAGRMEWGVLVLAASASEIIRPPVGEEWVISKFHASTSLPTFTVFQTNGVLFATVCGANPVAGAEPLYRTSFTPDLPVTRDIYASVKNDDAVNPLTILWQALCIKDALSDPDDIGWAVVGFLDPYGVDEYRPLLGYEVQLRRAGSQVNYTDGVSAWPAGSQSLTNENFSYYRSIVPDHHQYPSSKDIYLKISNDFWLTVGGTVLKSYAGVTVKHPD